MSLEIIAEIHPQHGGSAGVVREMIRIAKRNGATVVKIQLYNATKLLGPDWSYIEVSQKDLELWQRWCDDEEIELLASIFDETRLKWCKEIGMKRYKIASRTVVEDPALCRQIIDLGQETLISLGMWDQSEKPFGVGPTLRYLYCKSFYPTFLEQLVDFPNDFDALGLAGYSDHTLGFEVCLLAISRGANIVEKHMTLDKTRTKETERAHICSMTPDELIMLSQVGGALHRTRHAVLNASRKSIDGD